MTTQNSRTLAEKLATIAAYSQGLSFYGKQAVSAPFRGMERQMETVLSLFSSIGLGYRALSKDIQDRRDEKVNAAIARNEAALHRGGGEEGYDNDVFSLNIAGFGDEDEMEAGGRTDGASGFSVGMEEEGAITGISSSAYQVLERIARSYRSLTGRDLDADVGQDEKAVALGRDEIHAACERTLTAKEISDINYTLNQLKADSTAFQPILGLDDFMEDQTIRTSVDGMCERALDATMNNPYVKLQDVMDLCFGEGTRNILDGIPYYDSRNGEVKDNDGIYRLLGDPSRIDNVNGWIRGFTGLVEDSMKKGGHGIMTSRSDALRALEQFIVASSVTLSREGGARGNEEFRQKLVSSLRDMAGEFMVEGRDYRGEYPLPVEIRRFFDNQRGKGEQVLALDETYRNAFISYSRVYNESVQNDNELRDLAKELSSVGQLFNRSAREADTEEKARLALAYRKSEASEKDFKAWQARRAEAAKAGREFTESAPKRIPRPTPKEYTPSDLRIREMDDLMFAVTRVSAELKLRAKLEAIRADIASVTPETQKEAVLFRSVSKESERNTQLIDRFSPVLDRVAAMDPKALAMRVLLASDAKDAIVAAVSPGRGVELAGSMEGIGRGVLTREELDEGERYHDRLVEVYGRGEEADRHWAQYMSEKFTDKANEKLTAFYDEIAAAGIVPEPYMRGAERLMDIQQAFSETWKRTRESFSRLVDETGRLNEANEDVLARAADARGRTAGEGPAADVTGEEGRKVIHKICAKIRTAEKLPRAVAQAQDTRNTYPTSEYFRLSKASSDSLEGPGDYEVLGARGLYWEDEREGGAALAQEKVLAFARGPGLLVGEKDVERYCTSTYKVDFTRYANFLADLSAAGLSDGKAVQDVHDCIRSDITDMRRRCEGGLAQLERNGEWYRKAAEAPYDAMTQMSCADQIGALLHGVRILGVDDVASRCRELVERMRENNPHVMDETLHLFEKDPLGFTGTPQGMKEMEDWLRRNRVMGEAVYTYQERMYPGMAAYGDDAAKDLAAKGLRYAQDARQEAQRALVHISRRQSEIGARMDALESTWPVMLACSGSERELYPVSFARQMDPENRLAEMTAAKAAGLNATISSLETLAGEAESADYAARTLPRLRDMAIRAYGAEKGLLVEGDQFASADNVAKAIVRFDKDKATFLSMLEKDRSGRRRSLRDQIEFYKSQLIRTSDSPEDKRRKAGYFVNTPEMIPFSELMRKDTSELVRMFSSSWENYREVSNADGSTGYEKEPDIGHAIDLYLKGINSIQVHGGYVYRSSMSYTTKELDRLKAEEDRSSARTDVIHRTATGRSAISSLTPEAYKKGYAQRQPHLLHDDSVLSRQERGTVCLHLPHGMDARDYLKMMDDKLRDENGRRLAAHDAEGKGRKPRLLDEASFSPDRWDVETSGSYVKLTARQKVGDDLAAFIYDNPVHCESGHTTAYGNADTVVLSPEGTEETLNLINSIEARKVKQERKDQVKEAQTKRIEKSFDALAHGTRPAKAGSTLER